MTTSEAIIRVRELVGDARIAMVTTGAPSGELHSRPLTVAEIDDNGNLSFLVDSTADWVAGLAADDQVNVSITNDDDQVWISIAGTGRVSEDKATIHRLWTPVAEVFFPDGVDSPSLRVLTVAASTAEYWDAPASRVQRLAVMAKAVLGDKKAKMGESGSIDLK